MKAIRLSERATSEIKRAALKVFGPEVRVYLFGSRTDPEAKGGDVDLLVRLPGSAPDWLRKKLVFSGILRERLERKVDVVVWCRESEKIPGVREFLERIFPEAVEL